MGNDTLNSRIEDFCSEYFTLSQLRSYELKSVINITHITHYA